MAGSPDVSKATIKTLITLVVIPTGVLAFIGALAIKTEKKQDFSTALLIIMALLTVSFVSGSIYQAVSGNGFKIELLHPYFIIAHIMKLMLFLFRV